MSTTRVLAHTARPLLWLYQHRYAGLRPFQVCTIVPPHTPHSTIPVSRYFESRAPTRRGEPRLKPRVDDARLQHVHVVHRRRVVPSGRRRGQFYRLDDLADRRLQRPLDDHGADLLVALEILQAVDRVDARSSATPPPGTMPSSTAARVALSASSARAFFSFIAVLVAAPTLMTATPPASLASRSCSFSRS